MKFFELLQRQVTLSRSIEELVIITSLSEAVPGRGMSAGSSAKGAPQLEQNLPCMTSYFQKHFLSGSPQDYGR